MTGSKSVGERGDLVLGVDTCGASGTVALARIEGGETKTLGQKELAGRTYSAALISAVGELLAEHGAALREIGAIVVVHGPGSFTGVRVGLSAVKGLAEPGQIPVVAVSRLAVLAAKGRTGSAALDAHRHEVFLRIGERELLAGVEDLAHIAEGTRCGARGVEVSPVPKGEGAGTPRRVAVCDDAATEMVSAAWGEAELVRIDAPTATDAIELCVPKILSSHPSRKLHGLDGAHAIRDEEMRGGGFADLAMLDGHYLRRSDAEIFGEKPGRAAEDQPRFTVRRMVEGDVDRVVDLAAKTHHAPGWQRETYTRALDPDANPRRIALVAEERSTGELAGFVVASIAAPESELESIVTAVAHQRRGVARELFSRLKTELRRQSVHEVMLEVRAGNHGAQGFYRFLGFMEDGRRPGYYPDPVEDAVLMRVRLKSSY